MNLNDLAFSLWPFLARLFCDSGTWTPSYFGLSTLGVTTYTTQYGRYTKIFDICFFTLFVQWTNATGTGAEAVDLPFVATADSNAFFSASLWHYDMTYAGTGIMPLIVHGTQYIQFATPTSNAPNTTLGVEVAGRMVVSGWYFV